ncbi:hypothetical protein NXU89_17545 [Bacteroides uniformis]|nr:hypothetical protein [Bacteroides uniformis]
MKKILFIASAILILLSGCENFLDSELLTEKTTANFPETEKDAQEMVTAIYAHLLFESPETSSQYYIAQLAGDDCLGGNLSYSNNCATNFLMYSGNLNTFAGIWDRCYTLINRANNAINTMENVKSWSARANATGFSVSPTSCVPWLIMSWHKSLAEFLYAPHWKAPTCRVHP